VILAAILPVALAAWVLAPRASAYLLRMERGAATAASPRAGATAARRSPSAAPSSEIAGTTAPRFSRSWLDAAGQPGLPVKAQAAVLLDVDDGQVLWAHDATGSRAPASLTKLVTAMVVADLAPMGRTVTVTADTDMAAAQRVEPDSTVMGLTAGEVLTVRELLAGLFLRSGNDAAETLAAGLAGRARFVDLMNEKASRLGMTASHFSSPVGLDAPDMRSSAYDLGLAAATIVTRYPRLLEISGLPFVHLDQTATHKPYDLVNYNRLVRADQPQFYAGATGMKTAFTDDAGPCMVATAMRGHRRLVAIVLHTDDFFADAHTLLDYGFSVTRVS
jgi:serine-type D-Ala-D-Ala carboxypeptidase (penicillin-binding protein 5/6)